MKPRRCDIDLFLFVPTSILSLCSHPRKIKALVLREPESLKSKPEPSLACGHDVGFDVLVLKLFYMHYECKAPGRSPSSIDNTTTKEAVSQPCSNKLTMCKCDISRRDQEVRRPANLQQTDHDAHILIRSLESRYSYLLSD